MMSDIKQKDHIERNLEETHSYFIECSWCDRRDTEEGVTKEKAVVTFHRNGWRHAADASQEGLACPDCLEESAATAEEIIKEIED